MRHRFLFVSLLLSSLGLAACGAADEVDQSEVAREPQGSSGEVARADLPEPARLPPEAAIDPVAGAEIPAEAAPGTEVPAGAPVGSSAGVAPAAGSAPNGAAPAPVQSGGTAANDILERAEERYAQLRSMEADFVQEVYVPLLETTQHSQGKLFHLAPDRFLMRFSQPQGDVVVADGQHVWMYYPSTDDRQVMRSRLTAGGQRVDLHREFLSDATERFSATRTGSETIGGRQTHALTLVPRGRSPYREVRLWIDTQDHLVRRFEITEENGSIRKLEMRNLRPNASLSADLFRFTPPPGVQVHDF